MSKELSFSIFCLENYKLHRNMNGREVFELFTKYKVFDYLREFYDVLHTTGSNYVNHDIDCYLAARGAL